VSGAWLRELKVAQFLAILATGLLAGLLFEFWFFIAPALATLRAPAFIQVTQAIDRQFLVPIAYLYISVIVFGLHPPADWATVRDRWDQANAFRTGMLVLAFVDQILAALISTERPR
jgi:hypothetical protein